MAKDKKANQSIKQSKRSKAIMASVIIVCLLIIIGFFVYISGIIPKTLTGIKITETTNGVTKDIEKISVLEANYQFYKVINQWYNNGNGPEDLDAFLNGTDGKTYRQFAYDTAAENLRQIVVLNRAANTAGFADISCIQRYSDISADGIRQQAELYGYPSVDQYLIRMYGDGMSIRAYRNIIERENLAAAYEEYARQFLCVPTQEQIQEAFNADPSEYYIADFQYYYFAGDTDEEGNVDFTEALRKANDVIDNTTDAESFTAAVVDVIGEEAAETAGFSEENDPTLCEGYTKSNVAYYPESFVDFVFVSGEVGEASIVTSDNGVFAVHIVDRHLDETPVISYRCLTLYNELSGSGASEEKVNAALEELRAECTGYGVSAAGNSETFANYVRQNSEAASEILNGGLTEGVPATQYTEAEENTMSSMQMALGEWLVDESRVHGDYFVQNIGTARMTVYFFEESIPAWEYNVRMDLQSEMATNWENGILSADTSYAIAYDLCDRFSTAS